jgi:hypothetical protein
MKYSPDVETRTNRRKTAALSILRLVTVRIEKTTIIAEKIINIIGAIITQLLSLIVNLVYLMF